MMQRAIARGESLPMYWYLSFISILGTAEQNYIIHEYVSCKRQRKKEDVRK